MRAVGDQVIQAGHPPARTVGAGIPVEHVLRTVDADHTRLIAPVILGDGHRPTIVAGGEAGSVDGHGEAVLAASQAAGHVGFRVINGVGDAVQVDLSADGTQPSPVGIVGVYGRIPGNDRLPGGGPADVGEARLVHGQDEAAVGERPGRGLARRRIGHGLVFRVLELAGGDDEQVEGRRAGGVVAVAVVGRDLVAAGGKAVGQGQRGDARNGFHRTGAQGSRAIVKRDVAGATNRQRGGKRQRLARHGGVGGSRQPNRAVVGKDRHGGRAFHGAHQEVAAAAGKMEDQLPAGERLDPGLDVDSGLRGAGGDSDDAGRPILAELAGHGGERVVARGGRAAEGVVRRKRLARGTVPLDGDLGRRAALAGRLPGGLNGRILQDGNRRPAAAAKLVRAAAAGKPEVHLLAAGRLDLGFKVNRHVGGTGRDGHAGGGSREGDRSAGGGEGVVGRGGAAEREGHRKRGARRALPLDRQLRRQTVLAGRGLRGSYGDDFVIEDAHGRRAVAVAQRVRPTVAGKAEVHLLAAGRLNLGLQIQSHLTVVGRNSHIADRTILRELAGGCGEGVVARIGRAAQHTGDGQGQRRGALPLQKDLGRRSAVPAG